MWSAGVCSQGGIEIFSEKEDMFWKKIRYLVTLHQLLLVWEARHNKHWSEALGQKEGFFKYVKTTCWSSDHHSFYCCLSHHGFTARQLVSRGVTGTSEHHTSEHHLRTILCMVQCDLWFATDCTLNGALKSLIVPPPKLYMHTNMNVSPFIHTKCFDNLKMPWLLSFILLICTIAFSPQMKKHSHNYVTFSNALLFCESLPSIKQGEQVMKWWELSHITECHWKYHLTYSVHCASNKKESFSFLGSQHQISLT